MIVKEINNEKSYQQSMCAKIIWKEKKKHKPKITHLTQLKMYNKQSSKKLQKLVK